MLLTYKELIMERKIELGGGETAGGSLKKEANVLEWEQGKRGRVKEREL
jgi:ribulose 1,5-bisphosphate synthetase/thiazole synthase